MANGPFQRLRRFLVELKRRNVYQVAVTYALVGFVLVQVADLTFVRLGLPSWTVTFVIVLVATGFPLALVLAWAFERTAGGVRRTPGAEPEGDGTPGTRGGVRAAYGALVGLGLVAAVVAGAWYLTGGGGRAGGGARLGERSVAVLPFEALGREEPGAFTAGMHDALLARLSNVDGLQVISRTAVEPYRDTDRTTGEIARDLGVRWVLEGGVQEMGNQIQVNAQLIDPRSETHAWAETYRRELTAEDLFDLQSDITKRIVRSLEAQLTSAERDRVERQPTESLEAYRLYVQGRTLLDQRTGSAMRQAMDFFRRSIDRDSTYALAWSGRADARTLLVSYGHARADTVLPRAMEAARRALRLDPELAEAHASMGLLHQDIGRNGPAAVLELHRATELKPSHARAHHWLGVLLAVLGRWEAGTRAIERAARLDPMSPSIHVSLAAAYRHADLHREALEEARRTRRLAPSYSLGVWATGVGLSTLGRQREAVAVLRRVLERTSPGPYVTAQTRAWLAVAHHRAGDTARARELLDEILEADRVPYAAATVHAELGEWDAAIEELRATEYDYLRTSNLRYNPVFDPIRDDPRFRRILRDVNRQWGLGPDGSFPDSVDLSFDAGA